MKKPTNNVLFREFLNSGEYLASFTDLPSDTVWPMNVIEKSFDEALNGRPNLGNVWVFGYVSLMRNTLMNFSAQRSGILQAWHRSFCLRLIVGRGRLFIFWATLN